MKAANENFLALDYSDLKILLLLISRSVEFSKLDFTDQKLMVWFLIHSPQRLKSWIEYLRSDYEKRETTAINPLKLFYEISELINKRQ